MPAVFAAFVTAVQLLSPQVGLAGVANPNALAPARLLVTTDGGARFRAIGPRVPPETVVDDVQFLDPLHGWVVIWNVANVRARLYRTSDGGRTWRSVEVASHGAHAGASDTIQFLDRRRGWLVVQEPTAPFATLFATADGGVRWRMVSGLPEVAPVRFTSARVAWQAGGPFSRVLYRSGDAGRHWRRVPLPAQGLVGLPAAARDAILVAVTAGRRTTFLAGDTSGRSWRRVAALTVAASPPAGCAPAPVTFVSRSVWWLAVVRGGRATVYRTLDRGRRWTTSVPAPRGVGTCPPSAVAAVDGRTAWVDGISALAATHDGGATWTTLGP